MTEKAQPSQDRDHLLRGELEELRAKHLYRRIRTMEKISPVRARLGRREILLFCGNDYLGLSYHPRVIAAFQETASRQGVGSGAARLISGAFGHHAKLEEKLAAMKKKPRALLFSTGYLANLGILTALAGPKDLIVMDKLCHASIVDGARLSGAVIRVFPHRNYERCEEILSRAERHRRRLLVTESVFSMEGDIADLAALARIKEKYDCFFVVDDAHGAGVLGKTGGGGVEHFRVGEKTDVIMGTLSKALGCLGGFAAGSETLMEYLINFARPFIFATSLPPAICRAALEAARLLESEPSLRERLWKNVRAVYEALSDVGFQLSPPVSPIIPVILGEEQAAIRVSEALLEDGIWVPAVRTPAVPKGKARLRITVSSAHSEEDICRLAGSFRKAMQFC